MDMVFEKQPSELAASSAMAGAKVRPRLRKHVLVSTLSNDAKEKSFQHNPHQKIVAILRFLRSVRVPDNDMINQSIRGTLSEDVKRGVHCCMEPTDLHARAYMDSETQRCKDRDMAVFWDIRKWQHTGKFQPKPRFHGNLIKGQNHGLNEASQPHCFTDDIDHTHYKNVIKKFQQEVAARKAAEEEEDEVETAGEGATEAENATTAKCEEMETASDAQVEAENGLRSDGGDDDECDYWASYRI
ncbi:hypothetical protein ISN44_As09g000700 [Arabidopsis suecica]|uniref:Uncharacterized protein n=1 Tax=Arabidopsis suecica TaxID=45249 RepID=A0A8T2AG04_ARASU|nr:hypothetical protein ISN44_As09g000700 [Arabidopsis suecica]